MVHIDQQRGVEEHESDIAQRQKMYGRGEDLPERQPSGGQSRLHGRCPDLESEFQRPVRPYEVVIAANQLEVIFEVLLPSRMANRPPK